MRIERVSLAPAGRPRCEATHKATKKHKETKNMNAHKNSRMEELKEEAKRYEEETGRPVAFYGKMVEFSEGKSVRMLSWRTQSPKVDRTALEAVELMLKSGLKAVRDEDGVVRLYWPEVELGGAVTDPPRRVKRDLPPDGCWHVEVTAWPIRSKEAASLMQYFLSTKGWCGLTPRALKQAAQMLEGHALRHQQPIDIAQAAERNVVLEAILYFFSLRPEGWQGTANRLLACLESMCEVDGLGWTKDRHWPKNGQCLTYQIGKLKRWLDDEGIVFFQWRCDHERRQVLRYAGDPALEAFLDPEERAEPEVSSEARAAAVDPIVQAESLAADVKPAEPIERDAPVEVTACSPENDAVAEASASLANSVDDGELEREQTLSDGVFSDFEIVGEMPILGGHKNDSHDLSAHERFVREMFREFEEQHPEELNPLDPKNSQRDLPAKG